MATLLIVVCTKYLIALSVLIAAALFFRMVAHERKQGLIMSGITLVLTYAAAKVASLLYFDPRPFVVGHFTPLVSHAADNGFPSDHTLLAAAIAAVVTKYNWRLGVALWIIAILVGAVRVLAGLHHPIDILGSLVIAGLVAWFTFTEVETRINV